MAQKFRLNAVEDMTNFMGFGDDHLSIVTEKTLHTKYDKFAPNTTMSNIQPQFAKLTMMTFEDLLNFNQGTIGGKEDAANLETESTEKRKRNSSAEQLARVNNNHMMPGKKMTLNK